MGNKQASDPLQGGVGGERRRRRAPKGHFVVYVGNEELRRYIVPLSYLKNPSFLQLMYRSAEEYGFNSQKRIVLPCDESTFLMIKDLC